MSNQQRPFSWFRLAPFGRQLQPAPAPTPRPTALRAPAPQPFRPPAPQPRPAIRPPPPAVTSPPPPTRALFPGITTTTAAARSPTASTAPPSPEKSIPAATSVPSSPAATSTFLPITSSSFTLRSPETKTRAPPSSSLTTSSFPKPVASPPKTAAPTAPTTTVTASTTATTTLSPRTIKPLNESPQKYPETKPLFHPPPPEKEPRSAPLEEETKKLMLGQGTAGNSSKMNEKGAIDNKKITEPKILPRRLVTLIGENKGAIMVLTPNSTKKSYTNGFGGKSQTVGGNNEEGQTHVKGSNKKKEDQSEMNTMEMEESTLFINSNVQGVNNSILDDSSLTHHDPGFHIFFSAD
ncbi:hypothetical protein A4A49_06972 [Nicotiana attenuata]|uniref:Uncharacterized protein n=1 Tax=Nicotiana attenuata TaxID=49451 RepID=A0A1J6JIJ7_NICAT|nr:hypothetical protein A4A49_06972 [Nicotiana attenuata]